MTKRRAAIVSPLRTPVGRFQGTLAPLNAGQLGAVILKALMERSGIDPARALSVTRRYVRAFFDTYLKNMPDPLLTRSSPAYQEIRFP